MRTVAGKRETACRNARATIVLSPCWPESFAPHMYNVPSASTIAVVDVVQLETISLLRNVLSYDVIVFGNHLVTTFVLLSPICPY
jgi:hypothetical protein